MARPLSIIKHVSLEADSREIASIARGHGADLIVVGESLDEQGVPNAAGRRARRFADSLRASANLPVEMWDESLSSQDAARWRRIGGASRKRRAERIDAAAAAVILQSFLDSHRPSQRTSRSRGLE